MSGRNIAERAGRWSAAHWKTATFGWLAFVVVAAIVGQMVGTVKLSDAEQATGESARAESTLARAGFHPHAEEAVLVQNEHAGFDESGFRRTLLRTVSAFAGYA